MHPDESAQNHLKSRSWENDFDELEILLQSVVSKTKSGKISEKHFENNASDARPIAQSVSPLREHLVTQRDEYIQAVIKMSDGNIEKASVTLGFDVDAVKQFLDQI